LSTALRTTPPEKTLANISGKIVIISNIIQVQKPVGKIHPDPLRRGVHFEAKGLHKRDEDLAASAVDDEEVPVPDRQQSLDGPDQSAVLRDDFAADELEVVIVPVLGRGQGFLRNVDVQTGETVGPGQGVDAPKLQKGGIPVESQGFDVIRLVGPSFIDVYLRKKKDPRGPLRYSFSLSSPSLPWLLRIFAILIKSTFLDDLEVESPLELHPGGAENDADRAGRPPLLSDDLAQILRGDFELKNRGLFAFELGDLNPVRAVNESFGDQFYEFLHGDLL
jgi:hypothetical protein